MRNYKNGRNPILPPQIMIPDGEAHVMSDGKLYVYGSYDEHHDDYCSVSYHVVSTPDMKNWTLHEESFNGHMASWFNNPDAPHYPGIDWEHPTPFLKKGIESGFVVPDPPADFTKPVPERTPLLFAPDCIQKGDAWYLYFCMSDDSEGMAVSDRPEGPFRDPVQMKCGGIDPAIFIDDDGQAYYYWGQLHSHAVKLKEDMHSFDPEDVVNDLLTEEEHGFHEASSVRKIGNLYYAVYADISRGRPTCLGYSVSESPLGPFTYKGILIDNISCDPCSWNNHGCIECFHGQWYVFYHRASNHAKHHRRLCCEPITINADGTIDEVIMTSQGAGDPFTHGETLMSYQACSLKGEVYIGEDPADPTGELRLTGCCVGDEIIFRYIRVTKTEFTMNIRCSGAGTVNILIGGKTVGKLQADGSRDSYDVSIQDAEVSEELQQELKLEIEASEDLQIYAITM